LTSGYLPSYTLQVFWLKLYAALGLAVLLYALVRGRAGRNYSEFCHTLGLCMLWPSTAALEFLMWRRLRRERAGRY
jgi:hypothetical protein